MLRIIYFVGLSYLLIAMNVVRCQPDYLFNVEAEGWLKLHRFPATWQEAFLKCHYDCAVLASPISTQLTTALTSQVTRSGLKGHMFLGTHDLYSKGHFASIEGVPVSKMDINWSDEVGTGDCLSMSADTTEYLIKTTSCTDRLPFMCYRKYDNETMNKCGNCDDHDNYHYNRKTGSCYKLHQQKQSWSKAYGICDTEGGYLAILNNKEEADILNEMFLQGSERDRLHIGLAAWTDDRIWVTIHGEQMEDVFNNWDVNEPNNSGGVQNRGSFTRNGVMDDIDPDYEAWFVCEKSPKSTQFQDISETIDVRFS